MPQAAQENNLLCARAHRPHHRLAFCREDTWPTFAQAAVAPALLENNGTRQASPREPTAPQWGREDYLHPEAQQLQEKHLVLRRPGISRLSPPGLGLKK